MAGSVNGKHAVMALNGSKQTDRVVRSRVRPGFSKFSTLHSCKGDEAHPRPSERWYRGQAPQC